MPVVIKCRHCEEEFRMADAEMIAALQARGMLKREKKPELSLVRELLCGIADGLPCSSCGGLGGEVKDDWEDDWSDEVMCAGCGVAIDPDRLEIFPDTKWCPQCQKAAEAGEQPGAEPEFCSFCGGLMKMTRRGGAGLAGYAMVCSDCGKRG